LCSNLVDIWSRTLASKRGRDGDIEPTTVTEQLMFRDYLIQHPERAALYRELKLKLAAANTKGMLEYLEGKTPFIRKTLRLAQGSS
jgi:GrpB-like predicted nucleotidyltransferase (UPF0157 family)